jgi:hypothetical protein
MGISPTLRVLEEASVVEASVVEAVEAVVEAVEAVVEVVR